MSPELQDKLINKYPEQFKNLKYIECNDGWFDLLDNLCATIESKLNTCRQYNKPLDFWWSQIKEKFGGLRAYSYSPNDYIRGVVAMAENMSYNICEVSGDRGKTRTKKLDDNGNEIRTWIRTLSDNEAKKEGYL